jgi:CubicO group peptidase (beta-lactamase class C family)
MKWPSILSLVVVLLFISVLPVCQAQQPVDIAAIDAYIINHMEENQIPGLALCIVHNDEIIYTQGYGVAGPDGTLVTPQTPFVIGSISKSFTALAIMQLVEAGDIELDATVETYLPWFMANSEEAKLITIRHLLTHSSGISGGKDILNPEVSTDALETHIRELSDYSLSRPAGESYVYNNVNYEILGLIVQTVSGESFEDYIEKYIYSPLEMTNSYTSKEEAEANGLTMSYIYFFGRPRVSANNYFSRSNLPSGLLMVSAEDLGHYLIAQLNGGRFEEAQILSPENVALMHQPAVEIFDGVSYAFGWNTNLVEGEPSVWHGGYTGSFYSNIAFSPTLGWGVAIVINVAGVPQFAALDEPIFQVFRLSSGYDTGGFMDDYTTHFYVIWGIAILSVVLNLVFLRTFRLRVNKNQPLSLVRHLILPFGANLLLVYLMYGWFPSYLDSTVAVMFVFLPDTSLLFLASTVVNILTILIRIVSHIRITSRTRKEEYQNEGNRI